MKQETEERLAAWMDPNEHTRTFALERVDGEWMVIIEDLYAHSAEGFGDTIEKAIGSALNEWEQEDEAPDSG